jgi:imidazolonepropionase-like amidohydrolase
MLEAQKHRIFVSPGLSVIEKLLYDGDQVGISHQTALDMGYGIEIEAAEKSLRAMHKRGIKILPGGDYGFAWAKHGENANDLQYLVKYAGMTHMEALMSATRLGGEIMLLGNELGQIKEGYLADILLVDGDPLADLGLLLDKKKLLAIMKDGKFHKSPELKASSQSSATRWSLHAA